MSWTSQTLSGLGGTGIALLPSSAMEEPQQHSRFWFRLCRASLSALAELVPENASSGGV